MKIAIVGTTAHSILGFRIDLIKALVAKGHQVYAFAFDYNDQSMASVRQLGATPVLYSFNRAGLNPWVDLLNTRKLSKQFRDYGIEQTFCYFSKPVIFGTWAAVLAGVKHRYGMLEGLGFTFTQTPRKTGFKKRFLKAIQVFLYKRMLPKLTRLILLNQDDRKDLIDHYQIKVDVAILGAIGLNLSDYPYVKPPIYPVSFIFVGRLLKEKGIFEYVAAAQQLKALYPETKYHVIGMVDEENPSGITRQQLHQCVNQGSILYHGFVENTANYLQNSSVFVLPSYREGYPRSTQEAMATGRAVITTDVPGCKETVTQGVNGFIIPAHSANALAEKMRYFIEYPEHIITMGEESYRYAVSHFDAQAINQRLMTLLDIV